MLKEYFFTSKEIAMKLIQKYKTYFKEILTTKQQIYLQSGQHSVGSETMPNRMEELVASALAIGASLGVLALPFGGLMVTFF